MKLQNKKTGEIGYLISSKDNDKFIVCNEDWISSREYNSLTELNAEWEDYEEPKKYWYVDIDGEINSGDMVDDIVKDMLKIGNYFEIKEEAELAVRKLKAWKLLKDECKIKFDGTIRDERGMLKGVKLDYDRHQVTLDRMRECIDALTLLFGGEE